MRRDPELKARFNTVHVETLGLIRLLIEGAIAGGALRPLKADERLLLAEMSWMLTLFWPNYLDISGETDFEKALDRGVAMIRLLLQGLKADQ